MTTTDSANQILKRPIVRAVALGATGPLVFFGTWLIIAGPISYFDAPNQPPWVGWVIQCIFGLSALATFLAGWRLYLRRDLHKHLRVAIAVAGGIIVLPMTPMLFAGDWWTLLPMTIGFCLVGGIFQVGFRTPPRFRRRRLARKRRELDERARRRALPPPENCPYCDYSLAGLPVTICPECGKSFNSTYSDS